MIIKKLELSNFQVIKDFTAEFDGNVYFITGENELGKSTVLKAIGALLTGNRDAVLKNGEDKGFAKMIVGDDGEEYNVELRYTKLNPRGTLTIKQKTTGMQTKNISMLQNIFGYTDFDAVEFSRMSETAEGRRKQIEIVKSLFPADIRTKIAELDNLISNSKADRTDVNRELKKMTAAVEMAAKDLEPGDVDKYTESKDLTALLELQRTNAELTEKAKAVRNAHEKRVKQLAEIPTREANAKKEYEDTLLRISDFDARKQKEYEVAIAQAKKVLDDLKGISKDERDKAKERYDNDIKMLATEKAELTKRKENAEEWLNIYEASNAENINTKELLADLERHNKKVAQVNDYKQKKADVDKYTQHADELTEVINTATAQRAELVAKAKLPIKGLSFDENGLTLNGVQFAPGCVSDSQIMEVAVKLIIASNPKVKVFRIARGESLGGKRLHDIVEFAKANGYQGFIEEVKRGQDDLVVEEYTEP